MYAPEHGQVNMRGRHEMATNMSMAATEHAARGQIGSNGRATCEDCDNVDDYGNNTIGRIVQACGDGHIYGCEISVVANHNALTQIPRSHSLDLKLYVESRLHALSLASGRI